MQTILADVAVPYSTAELFQKLGISIPPGAKPHDNKPERRRDSCKLTGYSTSSVKDHIAEGGRNATLASLAGSMRHRGMSFESIEAGLQQENLIRCMPPLAEDEVSQIAKSVSRYEPDGAASSPVLTRADLAAMIESTDDFDALTASIADQVTFSELREPEKEVLRKAIAKKSGISLATINKDAKVKHQRATGGDFDHLKTAIAVKQLLGDDNLIHAQGYLWDWDGSGVWACTDDREIKQKIHEVAENDGLTANVINSILDMLKTEAHLSDFVFDSNSETINCQNGELNFVDGKWQLLPHERSHYHTAMIPVAYDVDATAPRFILFLDEVFKGDTDAADKIQIVLEALGYTLISSCHLEKFFMLIGSGANGKSVLLFITTELVGRKYVSAVQPSQFENRFQRGHLQGKLANIITEIAEGAEIADAQLKSLVSGEMTTAEHKHKDPFDFTPYAKHWFGTNHLPHTRDFSDALFRRAIILSFNNKFEGANRDVHLADKLKAELPGILNLALAGLQRLIERNAFTESASSAEVARQWRMEADQAAQFVDQECETGSQLRATSAELFMHYQSWAADEGIKRTLNRNNFTKRLERLGFKKARGTGGGRMIAGIRSKTDSSQRTRARLD
jgi:putative DNA primase/helicase